MKMISKLDTTKKKIGLCILLIAVIGTGAVCAANSDIFSKAETISGSNKQSTDTDKYITETAPSDGTPGPNSSSEETGTLMTQIKDGITYYSYDGGETWSEETPEGVHVENNNNIVIE